RGLLGHEQDAQRDAPPRRPGGGQERTLARRVTGGRRTLGPRVPRESQKEWASNERQRCRCSPDELACRKRWQSLAPPLSRPATQMAEIKAKVDRPEREPQSAPISVAIARPSSEPPSWGSAGRPSPFGCRG